MLLAQSLRRTGLARLLLFLPSWRGVLILNYHRIGDFSQSELDRGVWSATAEALDYQLRLVTKHFDLVGPNDLDASLLERSGRHVMVTFDDGYRDLFELAHPVLRSNDARATMFLCSGFIDGVATPWWDEIAWMLRHSSKAILPAGPWSTGPRSLEGDELESAIDSTIRSYWWLSSTETIAFLDRLADATGTGRRPLGSSATDWITWDMARVMRAEGQEIGAHTVTHPLLARCSGAQQQEEIEGSIARIEAEIGTRPRWFSYPGGTPDTFDSQTVEYVHHAGVQLAFSNYSDRVTRTNFAALDVRRVSIGPTRHNAPAFAATLALPQVFARPAGRA
jgi:peptidoglycan/xylan/chitin deacetylase (PgdA/CDA1 family)